MFINIDFIVGMIILFVPIVACVYAYVYMSFILKQTIEIEKELTINSAFKISLIPAFTSLISAASIFAGSTLVNQVSEPKLFDLITIVVYTFSIALFLEKGPTLIREHLLQK